VLGRRGENFGEEKRWEKKICMQGGWDFHSSEKRPQRAHPQLVHWWLLVHSSQHFVLHIHMGPCANTQHRIVKYGGVVRVNHINLVASSLHFK
jgi:hypothetical protein